MGNLALDTNYSKRRAVNKGKNNEVYNKDELNDERIKSNEILDMNGIMNGKKGISKMNRNTDDNN